MKTYIIYLAAGNSRRFGSNKLLHRWRGKPLYRYGLDELIKLAESRNDCQIIIISQSSQVIHNHPKIVNLINPLSSLGISYSIKAGLQQIDKTEESYNIMFVVADQPYLKSSTIANMLDIFNDSDFTLASLAYLEQAGNPTIFKNIYFDELMQLTGDQGGRKVINNHSKECLYYEVNDPQELQDIDERIDLTK